MEIAQVVAKRSTCFRLNVGAVVVRDNNIISIGYNGAPAGEPHCTGASCPGALGCTHTLHAERNALMRALDIVPPMMAGTPAGGLAGCDLYVTDSPCQECAEMIRGMWIYRLFFGKPYRLTDPLDWLTKNGDRYQRPIEIYQVTPAGYTINWLTKELIE